MSELALPDTLMLPQATACLRGLQTAMQAGGAGVRINASALRAFDSSALAVLLECRRLALAQQQTFAVVSLPVRLRDLAALYGVAELLSEAPAAAV